MNGHHSIIEPTPTNDDEFLISSESGRRTATVHYLSSGPGYTRQPSRGSTSPMTPMTESDPFLSHRRSVHNEACAAAAASGSEIPLGKGTEMRGGEEGVSNHNFEQRPVEGEDGSDDSHHLYSEIKNVMDLPPCKRPLPQTPPPFSSLRGQPAPFFVGPQMLPTLNFVSSQPGSGMDQPTYIAQGNEVRVRGDLCLTRGLIIV